MNRNIMLLVIILATAALIYILTVKDMNQTAQDIVTGQTAAESAAASSAIPQDLMLDGVPVSPLCFMLEGDNASGAIDLTVCERGYIRVDSPDAATPAQPEDNGYQTAYYRHIDEDVQMRPSMIRYNYLGQTGAGLNILVESSGGGTGYFSALYAVKRQDEALIIQDVIAGGDRCNSGLESARIYDGMLVYNQFITPFDLLVLADNVRDVRPYEDLDACASCCYGVARYNQEGFRGVSLTVAPDFLGRGDGAPERGLQNCFETVLKTRMEIGQIDMPPEVLASFVQEFHDVCTIE